MAGWLLGIVAQHVAAMLRRMARALDASQGDRALDAATEALRARFPGAPDHWLRYIALRAPALAAAKSVDTEARVPSAPESRRAAPDLRFGQGDDGPGTAPLKLERKARRTRQEPLVAERFPAPAKKPASDVPRSSEWIRPKLRVIRSEFSARDTAVENSRDGVERRATRVKATERSHQDSPEQTPVPSPKRVRLEESVARTPAKWEPRAPAGHAGVFGWFALPRLTRMTEWPQAAVPRIRRAPESADLSPREWSEPPQSTTHALSLGPAVATQRANRFERLFSAAALQSAAGPAWSIEDTRSRWPELPPSTDDAEPMPVTLPNLAKLRAEQDRGAWSG
jgi:hypothetical protein